MRARRRAHRGLAGLVAALITLPLVAGPAGGASEGACTDASGVTVVVDFRALGGDTIVRCAPLPVDDGLHALRKVGVTYDTSARFPGMVCRLDGVPVDEPCQGAPPADYYWSYWTATDDAGWRYSQRGASGRTPPPGSAEGWSFSTDPDDSRGSPPRTTPTVHTAPPPSPPSPNPTPTPTSATTSPTAIPPAPAAPPAPATTSPTPRPTPVAPTPPETSAPASPSTAPRASLTPTPRATTARDTPVAIAPSGRPAPTPDAEARVAAASDDDRGSPAGTLLGLGLLGALALAAVIGAARRRTP